MLQPIQYYLKKFEKLRVDRSHGAMAPHKPILLISVLQACYNGLVKENKIYITPELVAMFKSNWALLVTSNHHCKISYPFFYLKSDKFWTLVPKADFVNNKISSLITSFSNFNAVIDYATVDAELFSLMKSPSTNSMLLHCLLENYFPATRNNFDISLRNQQSVFAHIEDMILHESPAEYCSDTRRLLEEDEEEEVYLRGSVFKREVPKMYDNECCVSGMRVDVFPHISMIDACHIVPFCESYNDTITNGIALCPNLHRAFDRGLIAIDDEYKLLVSNTFKEADSQYSIRHFEGKPIKLPHRKEYFPLPANLAWHRDHVFKA